MSAFSDLVAESLNPEILDAFGDEVTYTTRAADASYAVTVVLDTGEQVQQAERVYQTAWAPLSSFESEPARGDLVVIGDSTYRVADVEKQPQDGRLLKLSLTNPR